MNTTEFHDKMNAMVTDFVGSQLQPGEQVRAAFFSQMRLPPVFFLLLLFSWLTVFWVRQYAVVLTDRRVIAVRCKWNRRPRSVLAAAPLTAVHVREWKKQWNGTMLRLDGAGVDGETLQVVSMWKPDAEALVAALSTKSSPAAAGTTSSGQRAA